MWNQSDVLYVRLRAINESLGAYAYLGGQKMTEHSREGVPNLPGSSFKLAVKQEGVGAESWVESQTEL
jgi:hypothetical protein